MRLRVVIALVMVWLPAVAAAAQQSGRPLDVRGEVSVLALTMPNQPEGGGTHELRSRARIDVTADPSSWLRLKFEGTVDAVVADRGGRVDDAVARVGEGWLEVRGARGDVRLGYGRLVWGRLDEIQPSDVLNPLETSTYFLEGRTEARLPISFVRGRVFLTDDTSIETIVSLPGRRGRFDALDEKSSPFNLLNALALPAVSVDNLDRREPEASWRSLQVGGRVSTTVGRVDASVSAYRGYEPFGTLSLEPLVTPGIPEPLVVGRLVERYSRFT